MKELIDSSIYIWGDKFIKNETRSEVGILLILVWVTPDMPTPLHIRQKLKEVIDKPGVGRYSVSKGINGLRKAQAKYYKKRFNVDLNPSSEIIVTIGSKEGLANLAQAITSKEIGYYVLIHHIQFIHMVL